MQPALGPKPMNTEYGSVFIATTLPHSGAYASIHLQLLSVEYGDSNRKWAQFYHFENSIICVVPAEQVISVQWLWHLQIPYSGLRPIHYSSVFLYFTGIISKWRDRRIQ